MPEKAPTAEQRNEEYGEALRQSVDEQAEQLERGYIDAVTQGSDETHPLHTDNVQALRGEVESDESLRAASEAQAEINRIENELSNPVLRASEKRDLQHQLDEWKQLKSSYDTAHQQTVEDFRDLLGAEAYHAAVDTVTKNYTDGFLTLAKNQKVKAEAEGKKQAEDQARADVEDALHSENPDEAKEGEHPKATSPIEEIADEELSAFQRILKNELDLRQDVVSHMIKIATEGEQAPEQAARIMDRLNALQTESPDEYERAVAEFDALEEQALEQYNLDHQPEVAQPESEADETEAQQIERAATAELLENFKLEIGQAERAVKGEDRILRNEELGLFGVIDGMGGEGGGDVAAQIIHDTIEAYVREAKESGRFADEGLVPILRQAVEECQDALQTAIDQGHGTRRMGAAGTFMLVEEHPVSGEFTLAFAHVGDTRLYVNSQALTEDEGVANRLRQAIVAGGYELDQLSYVTLMDGDRIVLCSDGITGDLEDEFLTDAEFADALSQPNAQLSAERFLALSKKHDDKSVLVIDVHEKNEVQPVWPQPDVEHGSLHDRLRQNASQAEPDQQPSVVEPVQERPSFEPGKFKTDTYEIDGHRVNKWQVSETMTALGQAVRDLHNAKPRRQAKVLRQIHQQFGNYLGADQMTASEVEQRLRDAHTQLFGAFSSIQGWSDQNRAQYYRRASNWMNGAKQDKLNVPINGLQVPEPTPVLPIREDEPYSVTAENLSSVVERLRNKGGVKSDQDRAELNGAVQAFADRRLNTPAAVNVDELLQRTQDLVASGPSRTRGRVKRLRTGVRNRAGRVAQNVRSRRNRGGDDEIDAEV